MTSPSVSASTRASIRWVTSDRLQRWGVSLADALAVAIAHFDAAEDPWHLNGTGPVMALSFDDSYDASRILLTDRLMCCFPELNHRSRAGPGLRIARAGR